MQTNNSNGKNRIDNVLYNVLNYEYKTFHNIQEIGRGSHGSKVYRANWKNLEQYFVLKSFSNIDDAVEKEIINEVIKEYLYNLSI
jgi:hypothetical protein